MSSTIGRYEIVYELEQGSMGVIFLAHDPFMERQVIVKVLMYQHVHDEVHREFFQREAEIIAALEHPNIVPVYDFGWHGSQPYIVMRYMAGGSLSERLKRHSVKMNGYAKIISRVCEALDVAHARNIIHRDIKPSNVLFDISGQAFLADFGIAKTRRITDEAGSWLVGTPFYMSPEQALGRELDGRSDVYSLGVMLYEFLAGGVPFKGSSKTEVINAHIHEPVPNVLDKNHDLPEVWQEIVNTAMAKSPEDRYSSAGEFAQKVGDVASGRWYLRNL